MARLFSVCCLPLCDACAYIASMRSWFARSVRPMIGKMVITVDISSVAVYKSGPLIKVCLEYLECSPEANPSLFLNEKFIQKPIKEKLIKYLRNLKIRDTSAGSSTAWGIKNISMHGADSFLLKTGDREISMAVGIFLTLWIELGA